MDEKIKEIIEKYCLNVFRPIPDSLNISAEQAIKEYGQYIRQQTLEEAIAKLRDIQSGGTELQDVKIYDTALEDGIYKLQELING